MCNHESIHTCIYISTQLYTYIGRYICPYIQSRCPLSDMRRSIDVSDLNWMGFPISTFFFFLSVAFFFLSNLPTSLFRYRTVCVCVCIRSTYVVCVVVCLCNTFNFWLFLGFLRFFYILFLLFCFTFSLSAQPPLNYYDATKCMICI